MNGARIISGLLGRTLEAGGFPERRLPSTIPTGDGTSSSHPGAGA